MLAPDAQMDYVQINAVEKKLVTEAQMLLKEEWRRVQAGELTYRIARFAALAVSTASVVALVAYSIVRLLAL
jgi:hypothetical protein